MNISGVNLLAPGGQPKTGRWRGGSGVVAIGGKLDGATVQLRWAAHIDEQPIPIGNEMHETGRLHDAFTAPKGLLSIEISDRTADTFVSVDAFPVETHYKRATS